MGGLLPRSWNHRVCSNHGFDQRIEGVTANPAIPPGLVLPWLHAVPQRRLYERRERAMTVTTAPPDVHDNTGSNDVWEGRQEADRSVLEAL